MNKIYKVIYNKNKHRYEVVSELAKSHGGKCKTTVATAGDTNWLRRLWMRVRGGVNKSDEDGNPVTMSISRAAMVALMCISVWSAAAVSSSWVEGASVEGEPVSVKYDETTGTIKIVKTDPDTSDETILATYAVGGKISPITSIGTKNPTGIIAIGDQSKAVQSNTIAIGTDAHAGNVDGSDDTNGRIAIGTKTVASGDRSIALGNMSSTNNGSYNIVQGNDSIGIGTSTSIFGYSGVSIGRRNIIGIPDPDLVKDGVLTTKSRTKYSEGGLGGNSVIVGAYNVAYGNRSNVIGTYSRAMGSNSVAIGSGVQSLSDGAIAIGKGSGYEFEDGSRHKRRGETEYYGRDWELPPEYKVLKQVLSNDIAGDEQYKGTGKGVRYENGGILPKYNNYGAGSSDPGGFIVEGKNALGIGTYTQVRGNSAIGLATGEMTADLSDKDKSAYARAMRKIMDMEETLYEAKEKLKAGANNGDTAALESAVKAAEETLATAKKDFRKTYLTKYSFVDGDGALGVGRQILAQGDRSMAVGDYAKAISNDAIAYGGQTLANGTNSMAMGGNAHVGTIDTSFDNSMAIGSHTNVQAGNAVALGAFSQVTGTNSLALGFGTQSSTDSNNITYNSVSGHDSTLIGSYGNIAGNNSILIGSNGNIANDRVVGLGNNINIKAADQNDQENNTAGSVFLGDHAGYVKDSKRSRSLGQVDVVGSAGKMELTESLSSTKGALRDYTKDFIYIYMLERQDDGTQIGAPIAVRSDFAGGDSTVGVVSVGSTYEQQFNSLQDIKDYHSKVGSLITVPVDVTVQVTKNGVLLGEQQQTRYFAVDSTREEIYADSTLKEADKEKVWSAIQSKTSTPNTTYTVFETRRIQNVAPGLIGLNSTDAINGSQLFATNQMLGNLVGSLKKTLGDNVTVTEDGEITVAGDIKTLGWIAKADTVDGSNGKVTYDVDKETDETDKDYQARKAKLEKDGYIVDASKVMTFKAGKNIELVQKPGEFSISTIDTPSFKSVELRGETKDVDGNKVTPVTMLDSNGMQVYTETVTPDGDGTKTTKKVSTTVNNEGVTTDGTVKVTNGKDGGKDLVSLGKGSATTGETDQDFGTIHVDGKQGADGTITIDRGTKSLTDTANVGNDREKKIGADNPVAGMDRITYTTKGPNDSTINHEVATLDDGFFLTTSKDVTDKKAPAGVKLNDTIQFNDGTNTKVSTVTSEKGVHELHIDVSGLPVSYTDTDGDAVTKIGDKYYKSNQVVDGKPIDGATEVPADKVTNNVKVVNKDGGTTKQGSIGNVKSVFDSTIGNGGDTGSQIDDINDANKVEKVPGTNKFIKDLTTLKGDTPADKEKLNSVSTVGDLQKVALTPLFFEGDTADGKTGTDGKPHKNTFGRKLSETAKIIGGQTDVTKLTDGNIGVVSNGSDTLTIKLAKELKDLDSVKVSNGKDGDDAKDLVTIGKEVNSDAAPGTDGENGTIGLNGKNGSEAVITIDRGTKSMNDKVNLGMDPSQDISGTNTAANMDRITYTTKGPNDSTINH
uniref:ESPR-type extended signal peptide-containing protein n=1 Tax=uncultured Veillonella sp. TaxID=159268 RepID=UPI00258ED948